METRSDTGRGVVLGIIVASLSLSVLTIVLFNLTRGPERLPQQIGRFGLTLALCVCLHRGDNWARWAAVVLFSLGGLVGMVGGVAALSTDMTSLLLPLAMGLVYLACAAALVFAPSVRTYFAFRNARAS